MMFNGLKIVVGFGIPSGLKHHSINWAWNLQAQYRIPEEIILKSTHWDGRSLEQQKKSCENKEISEDTSRILFYNFLELILNRNGINGKECIYRTICEISFSSLKHNGIFGELIDVVFMPGKEKLPIDYVHAKEAGIAGAGCLSLYSKCQIGEGILDKFIYT